VSGFEEHLIAKIHPEVSPLWAVADSDGLFRNDEVDRLLTQRGAEVIVYDDPMAFRYRYEHQIRPRLESGEPCCHVVVLDPGTAGLRSLPADIYAACRHIEVALGDVFPNLSRKVMRELEPAVLSVMWEKRHQFTGTVLGDRDTADLVLRIAYKIETTFLSSFQDLIQVLVGVHFEGKRLPECLAARLEQVAGPLYANPVGIHDMIRNSGVFWQYMQSEWERWIIPRPDSHFKELATADFTFEEPRLRVLMDNLFLEGLMTPVPANGEILPQAWCKVGVASGLQEIETSELANRRRKLLEEMPTQDAGYQDWIHFAMRYSTHVAATFSQDINAEEATGFWNEFWAPVDGRFREFIHSRLESLCNLPPSRPVLAHHVAQFLARRVRAGKKVALLILDGLSLAQWKILRREIELTAPDICLSDDACFTMVPSVTNVGRQTLHAGELPVFFESTIDRTDVDAKRWKTFWDGACGRAVRSAHLNVEGSDSDLAAVVDVIESGAIAIAITVRMPDEIVHGATMGWRGITEQLKLWSRQQFLIKTITTLLDSGYELHLTSDHGNLEARGEGSLGQGVLVDRSGQRVRIYRDATIFAHSAAQLVGRTQMLPTNMLPPDYLPLIHTGRGAFVPVGQTIVCHGGTSMDEMVIPFIEISRTKNS
jgi:hypothetical protein